MADTSNRDGALLALRRMMMIRAFEERMKARGKGAPKAVPAE